jgi:hypothetical protein
VSRVVITQDGSEYGPKAVRPLGMPPVWPPDGTHALTVLAQVAFGALSGHPPIQLPTTGALLLT